MTYNVKIEGEPPSIRRRRMPPCCGIPFGRLPESSERNSNSMWRHPAHRIDGGSSLFFLHCMSYEMPHPSENGSFDQARKLCNGIFSSEIQKGMTALCFCRNPISDRSDADGIHFIPIQIKGCHSAQIFFIMVDKCADAAEIAKPFFSQIRCKNQRHRCSGSVS